MWKNRHKEQDIPLAAPSKDTLIVIGNGFDIWQDLDTQYCHFRAYYMAHRDEILKKLGIKKFVVIDENGNRSAFSDVELIYGDPFDPAELDGEFWNTFETSLAQIDVERINYFFGKEKHELKRMKKSIHNASRILREAFYDWISSIVIEETDPGYDFGEHCIFINFNYTDTLRKRFHVQESDDFHIHGDASDKESMIFGHAAHPQTPMEELAGFRGRFQGLSLLEQLLYETDKHVEDNICMLSLFLGLHGVNPENIKDIYVLGHSMGRPDLDYFRFLLRATSAHTPSPRDGEIAEELPELGSMEEFHLRLSYVVERYGYGIKDRVEDPLMSAVVERRLALEQMERNWKMEKRFFKALGFRSRRVRQPPQIASQGEEGRERRTEDATWHLSYFGDKDKHRKEEILSELGCSKYELCPSIDDCIKRFKR